MICSQNELEAIIQRAIQGLGGTLGVAEDVSKAIIWLSAKKYNGLKIICNQLQSEINLPPPSLSKNNVFSGDNINMLIAAIDYATITPVQVQKVTSPLLFCALLTIKSVQENINFDLEFLNQKERIYVGQASFEIENLKPNIDIRVKGKPSFVPAISTVSTIPLPIEVEKNDWELIYQWAIKITVSDSSDSRARGAGSGQSDND